MGLIVEKGQSEATQRTLPKKGQRAGVLTGLIDIGIQVREYKGEKKNPRREFIPIFTLMGDTYTTEDGDTFNCRTQLFPIGLLAGATRGHYYDFLQALDPDGKDLPEGSGDVTDLLGASCFCKMEYTAPNAEGIIYANCTSLSEIAEDYPVPIYEGDLTFFDTGNPSKDMFEGFSDYVKKAIRGSEGYTGSVLENVCDGDGSMAIGAGSGDKTPPIPPVDNFDDGIPF